MSTAVPREPAARPLGGRYALDAVLGRGGAATVYAARDLLLQREVAVKLFAARADRPEHLLEQEAEARLVAQLNHPSLTTLLDAGVEIVDGGAPQLFLVMERVVGADLRRRLRDGALTPLQAAYVGYDLAEGLQFVHRHGYLHRDVKPANILLDERAPARIRGKLTDFGISSRFGTAQGEFTTGTAAYLGPEQVEGLDATAATDVYSLGLVLLEALTATVAFPGSITESALARLERSPEVPRSVPEPFAEAIRAMTARSPDARPPLGELSDVLRDVVVGELVRRRPGASQPAEDRSAERASMPDIAADTPDDIVERVADLARRLTGSASAAVLAHDAAHVVVRAQAGGLAWPAHLPSAEAVCRVAMQGTAAVAVTDLAADPRTADSALTALGVGSVAAAPLLTHDGHVVGAVVAADGPGHRFGSGDLAGLAHLAALLMHDFELRAASRRALFPG